MDTTIKKPDKKSLCYLAIVLAIALLVFAELLYYIYFISKPGPAIEEVSETLQRQRIIERQLQELNELKGETEPLTKKEIQNQLKDLNKVRQSSQPLTEQEIQKQLEELNKLR